MPSCMAAARFLRRVPVSSHIVIEELRHILESSRTSGCGCDPAQSLLQQLDRLLQLRGLGDFLFPYSIIDTSISFWTHGIQVA